jgi:hypothetical protein
MRAEVFFRYLFFKQAVPSGGQTRCDLHIMIYSGTNGGEQASLY